ncbi:MAG: VCBS repeat-containing protein [Deltaproteobacteria bacterium]|nr:VCBS repeat-containing protein [Deltaproteobacteria bacterium]
MRFLRVIILVAALLMFLPVWSTAQQPLRVAVLPFTVHSAEDLSYLRDGIWDIISSRIIVEGEIEAVEKPLVERFYADLRGGDVSDQQARWLGARVGAEYVVYGSITKVGDYISLDAKVVHVPGTRPTTSAFAQHKGIDEVMTKVGTFAQDIASRIQGRTTSYERGRPGQLREHLMFQAVGYTKMLAFPKKFLKGVDAGDVDGDGKNELVVISDDHLWIYRDDGKELKLVGEFQESFAHNFLTLDVIDINGDKRAEICVTNAIGDSLQSFVLNYEDGAFRYLARGLAWYLRVVKVPDRGEVLVAQRMGARKDFDGPIRVVEAKGDKKVKVGKRLKTGDKGPLPKEVEWIYAFTSGRLTDPEATAFLVADEMDTVRLLDEKGDFLWKSGDDMGGSDNYIDRPTVLADSRGNPNPFSRRLYIPLRMFVKDLDGDGVDDVVAVVNKFLTGKHIERVREYDKGYVVGLSWDGIALTNAWRTQDIPGYVSDFQVRDVDNDGRDELVAVSVSSHFLKSDTRGLLMVFELYE